MWSLFSQLKSLPVFVAWQHQKPSAGAQLGVWRERQTHSGAQKNSGAHWESSGWSERTTWAPSQVTAPLSTYCLGKWSLTSFTDESNVRQQQQELERSCTELQLAVAAKEKAEQSLQQTQAQLEESNTRLERLRCELLRQQEQSQHGEGAAILGSRTAVFRAFCRLLHFTRGAQSSKITGFTGTAGNYVTS